MAALFPLLVKFQLAERLYPALLAGLGYEFYSSEKGLVIRISGYSQNVHLVVESLAAALTNFTDNLTEAQFRTFVEQKLREFYNFIIKPKSLKR